VALHQITHEADAQVRKHVDPLIMYIEFAMFRYTDRGCCNPRLGVQPRTCGNLVDRSSLYYTTTLDRRARFSAFQNTINFDFSPKTRKDMAKHKKVVWGLVTYKSQ
jgi:hypothetical protein